MIDELLYTQEEIDEWMRTCEELQEKINELEQARKETAREILRDIKYEVEDRNGAELDEDLSIDSMIFKEVLCEIAKQYGVEVEE